MATFSKTDIFHLEIAGKDMCKHGCRIEITCLYIQPKISKVSKIK